MCSPTEENVQCNIFLKMICPREEFCKRVSCGKIFLITIICPGETSLILKISLKITCSGETPLIFWQFEIFVQSKEFLNLFTGTLYWSIVVRLMQQFQCTSYAFLALFPSNTLLSQHHVFDFFSKIVTEIDFVLHQYHHPLLS